MIIMISEKYYIYYGYHNHNKYNIIYNIMLSSGDFAEIFSEANDELINEMPMSAHIFSNKKKIIPWIGACVKKLMMINNTVPLSFFYTASYKLFPSCGLKSMTINYVEKDVDKYILEIIMYRKISKELHIKTVDSRAGEIYYYYLIDIILPLFLAHGYTAGITLSPDGQRHLYVTI